MAKIVRQGGPGAVYDWYRRPRHCQLGGALLAACFASCRPPGFAAASFPRTRIKTSPTRQSLDPWGLPPLSSADLEEDTR